MSQVIPRAVTGGHSRKFAVAKAPLKGMEWQMLHTLAQCTPDLTDAECNECLTKANESLPQEKREGRVLTPSCNIRYDVNLFYDESAAAWADASGDDTSTSPPPVTKPKGMEESFL